MPTYWKRRYYQRRQRRRKYRFLPWRIRKTFRRRWRQRRTRRPKYKVKKKRFIRKKTKIIVKQFQPTSIKKCKIIGNKCIIQGSPKRCHHNFIQYYNSKVPELHPGGGGWSQLIFSLDSLYDDYQKMQNIWTTTNCNLPLVRYLGCTMKFYQTDYIDYIVVYDTCWPMVDTFLSHADSSPTSMLLKKNKISIPSRQTQTRKKPYKKVFIKPPSQLQTKWYFQRELCKTPLLMLTTTAMDFTKPFCSSKAESNNISVKCLNPYIFQNFNFQTYPQTSGWYCKTTALEHEDTEHKMYLYSIHANQDKLIDTITVTSTNKTDYQITPLCNPLDYKAGQHINGNYQDNKNYWGNIFYPDNLDLDSVTIYISLHYPAEVTNFMKTNTPTKTLSFTKPHGPLIYTLRYNPETDKGLKNIAWIQSTSKTAPVEPPEDINLQLSGFPLYVLFWGWTDWIKKAKVLQDLDQNGIIIFKTDQFDIQLPFYAVVDIDFIEGYDPYVQHTHDGSHRLPSEFSRKHWYPKVQFQDQTIENICMSGPACPRLNNNEYMQAFVKYKFHFKWGGCPKKLEKACDPCSQPIWTTPDNLTRRLEIKDPNTDPLTELYSWDWSGDYVDTEAIQRIKEHTKTDPTNFISTENKNLPTTATKKKEKQTPQEETKTLFLQLYKLQQQRQLLQELLCNRLTTK
nr:MAG: ORF1 [TTV-like mini virus]